MTTPTKTVAAAFYRLPGAARKRERKVIELLGIVILITIVSIDKLAFHSPPPPSTLFVG